MKNQINVSVVIPAYNPGKKIIHCLEALGKNLKTLSLIKNVDYELIIINDGGNLIDLNFNHGIKNICYFKIRNNRGVGYARQIGARISKYNYILYLDSDIVLEQDDTLVVLFEEYFTLNNVGSIGPVQSYRNLSDEFTSDFVCAKTCYGFEDVEHQTESSGIRSECCLIEKDFLKLVGGWKSFPGAGGEEFELGHRITKSGKKNYVTKKTNYTTFYDNLYDRSKTIISRTSSYLSIFIDRKKFETKGSFATFSQALSTFFTSLILITIFFSFLIPKLYFLLSILVFLNILVEFKFLKFALKFYKKKNFLIYLFGIYIVNISIILGTLIGISRLFNFKK